MDALGAVNLALPFVLIVQALNAMQVSAVLPLPLSDLDEAIKRAAERLYARRNDQFHRRLLGHTDWLWLDWSRLQAARRIG